jgi:putative endonuclease
MRDRQRKGADAEAYAKKYLISQGLTWIMSNYRSCFGEIDLIMRDSSVVVFVEVRARSSHLFGGGAVSVTHQKQQKIIKTAMLYMQQHKVHNKLFARFDVMSFDGIPPVISWIKDAFR